MWLSLTASLRDMFDPDTLETDNPEPPKKFWVGITVSFDVFWRFLRRFFSTRPFLLCAFLGCAPPALAAVGEICGDGIDDSLATGGSAAGTKGSCPANYHDAYIGNGCDADCDTPDKDLDGYTSDGSTGIAGTAYTDCDDTNPGIYPGRYVDVPGTSYKLCQTNGSYGSTVATATTPLCESPGGTSQCFYIDFASGNDANAGTYAAPWQTFGKIGGGGGGSGYPASPHTLVADDYVYIIGSGTTNTTVTYSNYNGATGTNPVLFETRSDGTSGHPWVIKWYPGATAAIATTDSQGLTLSDASYGTIDGLLGSTAVSSGGADRPASMVYAKTAHHIQVSNSYISSIAGKGTDNDAAPSFGSAYNITLDHNYIRNNRRSVSGTTANFWGINHLDETASGSDGSNHVDMLNTMWFDSWNATTNGGCIRTKHGVTNAETGSSGHIVKYNTLIHCGQAAISWSSAGLRATGNRIVLDTTIYGLYIWEVNGVRHEDNRFQYNTTIS